MVKKLFSSLYFKISFFVLIVEAVVFLILGNFYTNQFSQKIDEAIITAANIPGFLMSRGQLNYEAVRNPSTIEELLGGEKVEEAVIFNLYNKVVFASDRIIEGVDIKSIISDENIPEYNRKTEANQYKWKIINNNRYLINLTPITYNYENEIRTIGFLYLKIKVVKGDIEKWGNILLFGVSSIIGILLSSLGIAFFSIKNFIFYPLNKIIKNVRFIGKREFDKINNVKTNDEMETLAYAISNMAKQIIKADKLKDDILANTSHELRTPLNGIIGIAESLLDGSEGPLNERVMANLKMIISSGVRLDNLVNDILDFSKLKNQEIRLNVTAVDLKQIVNSVLTLSRPLIHKKEIKLINDVPDYISLVKADDNRLQQILYNLVGNAVKFTQKGEIVVSAMQKKNLIEIKVSDTGIGIPETQINNIFKTFYQIDSSSVREYSGTGIGLSITKHLIQLHHGEIRVESKEGVGSEFYFTIPVSSVKRYELEDSGHQIFSLLQNRSNLVATAIPDNEKALKGEVIPLKTGEPFKANILIVDDEPINLQLLSSHLKVHKYNVNYAYSGEEAIKIVKTQPIDALLLDVMMPRMSGFEVCRILRKHYTPNQLPVIMITAKNQVSDLTEGMESGANDYIAKPFSKHELLARLKTHLEIKNLNLEIEDTQKEIILKVGAVAESRSRETGNHVKRVAEYSKLLGSYYGLPEEEVKLIKFASPMHDIGKVGIPDSILNKPGKHTPEEAEYMRKHALMGYEMIGKSERKLLKTAAVIALTHHEKWDGTGYPRGIRGKDISIYGRITAIADVFDALGSDRCYKKAWELDKITELFKDQRGKHFDPDLVDIFFEHLEEFKSIRQQLQDAPEQKT